MQYLVSQVAQLMQKRLHTNLLFLAGLADRIRNLVAKVASCTGSPHSSQSLLLLGPPGVGVPSC